MWRRYAALIAIATLPTGCSILENDVERGYERATIGANPVAFTTADIRLVTQRRRSINGHEQEIVCAEPSPDVARAVAAALQISANVNSASGGGGGGSVNAATAEAVLELAGRSTALLGLRDRLYRACEAYANGAIGDSVYVAELSRYGQLMTTLFLGQDVASAQLTSPAVANANEVQITVPPPAAATPPAGNDGGKQSAASPAPGATQVAAAVRSAPAQPGRGGREAPSATAAGKSPPDEDMRHASLPRLLQLASLGGSGDSGETGLSDVGALAGAGDSAGRPVVAASVKVAEMMPRRGPGGAAAAPADPGAAAPGAAACPPAAPAPAPAPAVKCRPPKPVKPAAKPPAKKPAVPAAAAAPPESAPDALRRMNAQFLYQKLTNTLLEACINEFDTTRYLAANGQQNAWLRQRCNSMTYQDLLNLAQEDPVPKASDNPAPPPPARPRR